MACLTIRSWLLEYGQAASAFCIHEDIITIRCIQQWPESTLAPGPGVFPWVRALQLLRWSSLPPVRLSTPLPGAIFREIHGYAFRCRGEWSRVTSGLSFCWPRRKGTEPTTYPSEDRMSLFLVRERLEPSLHQHHDTCTTHRPSHHGASSRGKLVEVHAQIAARRAHDAHRSAEQLGPLASFMHAADCGCCRKTTVEGSFRLSWLAPPRRRFWMGPRPASRPRPTLDVSRTVRLPFPKGSFVGTMSRLRSGIGTTRTASRMSMWPARLTSSTLVIQHANSKSTQARTCWRLRQTGWSLRLSSGGVTLREGRPWADLDIIDFTVESASCSRAANGEPGQDDENGPRIGWC